MSNLGAREAICTEHGNGVRIVVRGQSKDLGGFSVRRVLPAPLVRSVGPFVFFDEMGPAVFPPGEGINVRPHPHIGLATVTFLFEGEILHRDSLGYVQAIRPGAVNLMTAGRGIVHSERTAPERLEAGQELHGLQVWMALPESQQEIDPAFAHYPGNSLPRFETPGATTTVVIGEYGGVSSPVELCARTRYLSLELAAGTASPLESCEEQLAVYLVSGAVRIGEKALEPGEMAVLSSGAVDIRAESESRAVVIGGENLGPRRMFWNFVHTSQQRIEQAKQDWLDGNFDMVPGDDEFIPLP